MSRFGKKSNLAQETGLDDATQAMSVVAAVGNHPAAEAALGAATTAQGASPYNLIHDLDRAVSTNQLSGAQAVAFLGGMASVTGTGTPSLDHVIRDEITSLIKTNHISAEDAVSALVAAAAANPAIQAATTDQIAALIKN